MKIKNGTANEVASWFCFNSGDGLKVIALNSGNLAVNEEKDYLPPDNGNGWYAVRFTEKGGGTELAAGSVSKDGRIMLVDGPNGGFKTASYT